MKRSLSVKIAAVAVAMAAFSTQSSFAAVSITGAGSTFDTNIINLCKVGWQTSTGNTLTYGGGGSGAGQSAANNGIGDLNFSDSYYTSTKSTIEEIPVVEAGISVAYNLNGKNDLYLSQKTLSDIFAGVVTKWNDPEIVKDNNTSHQVVTFKKDANGNVVKDAKGNPVVLRTTTVMSHYTLPNQTIRVVMRSDGSGTVQNFLSLFTKNPNTAISSVWTKPLTNIYLNTFPGSVSDPSNIGRILTASGSQGVANIMDQTTYSIGVMEASYVSASKNLRSAWIGNANGDFVSPTSAGAVAGFINDASIVNGAVTYNYGTTTPGVYILGIVSYALVDTAATGANASAATSFLKYMLSPACTGLSTVAADGYVAPTGAVLTYDNGLIAKLAQ